FKHRSCLPCGGRHNFECERASARLTIWSVYASVIGSGIKMPHIDLCYTSLDEAAFGIVEVEHDRVICRRCHFQLRELIGCLGPNAASTVVPMTQAIVQGEFRRGNHSDGPPAVCSALNRHSADIHSVTRR